MAAEVEAAGGSEFPAHYKVMLDKLNEQRQLDQFTDITLIVDGKQNIPAHSLYCCFSSEPLKKLAHNTNSSFHVSLKGISSEPTKLCWLHAVSSSTSSSRISPRSHW